MADLLGADFGLAEEHKLYACHDLLLEHKEALFSHLVGRWRDLFNAGSVPYRPFIPTSTRGLNPRLGSFRSFERRCTKAMLVEAGWTVRDHRSGNDRTFETKLRRIVVGALDMPSR